MAGAEDAATAVATLTALLQRAGAVRAVLLLDRGDPADPLVIDCAADGSVELAAGEEMRPLPPPESPATPLELPDVAPPPPLEVDLAQGTVTAAMGALDAIARAVRSAAALFPGRSALMVGWATSEPEAPLFLAARGGEPLVVSLGGDEYEMPPGWPD